MYNTISITNFNTKLTMKKTLMILSVTALSFSFTACNETKKDAAAEATTTLTVASEAAQDTVPAATQTPDEMFAAYETFVNKFAEVVDGVNKGETKAIVEYGKLMQEAPAMINTAQEASANFTTEQKEKYGKLVKKYADAVAIMAKKK